MLAAPLTQPFLVGHLPGRGALTACEHDAVNPLQDDVPRPAVGAITQHHGRSAGRGHGGAVAAGPEPTAATSFDRVVIRAKNGNPNGSRMGGHDGLLSSRGTGCEP